MTTSSRRPLRRMPGATEPEGAMWSKIAVRVSAEVDHDQVGADQSADRAVDAVVGAVAPEQRRERLECVPVDGLAAIDRELPERLDDVTLPPPLSKRMMRTFIRVMRAVG